MSTLKEDLTAIKEIQDGLVSNKVARFSYTQNAYDANTVNGVDEYNVNNEQNIPNGTASIMKVNSTVLDKGYRAQASSITRMLMNHFLGRISYNLNKINDNMQSLLDTLITKFPTALPANGGNADTANIANTASKVANSLTFGSKIYDGSSAQTITASDLGLLPPDLSQVQAVNIVTAGPSGLTLTPYTVPSDGWILDFIVSNPANYFLQIDGIGSNGTTPGQKLTGFFLKSSSSSEPVLQTNVNCPYPVKKGQVISVPSSPLITCSIKFAPCKEN